MVKKRELKENIFQLEDLVDRCNQQIVKQGLRNRHTSHALRQAYEGHMASLNPDDFYDLLETLKDGTVITHLRSVDLDELKSYVRKVFIDSSPPMFTFRRTEFEAEEVYPKSSDTKSLMKNIFRWR